MQLIRYQESFCFLVEMLVQVFKDMYPFLVIFFTFTLGFVVITDILEGAYDDEDYIQMGSFPFLINGLQSFRNSIGDLAEPKYGMWIPADTPADKPLPDNY